MKTFYTFCLLATGQVHVPSTINELYSQYKIDQKKTDTVPTDLHLPFLVQQETEDSYTLLTGFERFIKAKQRKLEELPCYLVTPGIAPFTKYSLIASYRKYEPNMSLMEEACVIKKGQDELSQEELYSVLRLMGYNGNLHQLQEILSLLDMDQQAQQSIHNGLLHLKSIKKLHHLTSADQNTVISLIEHYRLGGSKQSNLIHMAIELTKRFKTSLAEIVERWKEDREILDTKNIPQQAADLLRYLSNLCSPESIAAEQKFTQRVKQLHLPDTYTISHSNAFEMDTCELTISFANMDILEQFLPGIRNVLEDPQDSV